MHHVKFSCYCGMPIPIEERMEPAEARNTAAQYLRRCRRNGHSVAILERGSKWEVQTQSNMEGTAVTDDDGILWLIHETFECNECGSQHDTQEDAWQCCQPTYDDVEDDQSFWLDD